MISNQKLPTKESKYFITSKVHAGATSEHFNIFFMRVQASLQTPESHKNMISNQKLPTKESKYFITSKVHAGATSEHFNILFIREVTM